MSDTGRKDFSTKAKEAITPESQKSYLDQAKESVTDTVDKVQGKLQPEENKGVGQGVSDAFSKGKDEANSANHKSFSETASEYVDSAKKSLNDAAEYVSSSLHGAKKGAADAASEAKK
ncbi:hypothetical protein WICPIJ_002664 [Wickerhamomyces pijperi]|uniref:12 kDa heat shock protein n=1 Tax=Wickerhamomyces pijperi TaxID=599730 RepID=A0A9P8Q956_WICPI|nr:hypothetical protein WICPIJ_002664 [Wickerhamomyces pijperi]